MIQVGQKVRFDPFATNLGFGVDLLREEVVGTIVEVYYKHKWFSVRYGDNLRTSFKFCDIDDKVYFCK
jgi:hypothetical protein